MSTVTSTRWQLVAEPPAETSCLFCQSGGPLLDTALELDGPGRVWVCPDCVTALARTARVGSKAAEALRHEYESEVRERDERLRALADQLGQAEKLLREQRDETSRRGEALDQARRLASQAVGALQQIQ